MEYGIQMYSLRDLTVKSLESALEKVAQIGYKNVEFARFFDNSAKDVRKMLEKYDLNASGSHLRLNIIMENFDEIVAYHKEIGCSDIIMPTHDLSDAAKLDEFVKNANKYSHLLAKEGLMLHYHNHSHEFKPNEDGTLIFSVLENCTDLLFEIDTYWAYVAKTNPIKLIERLSDRIKFIHLKDGDDSGKGAPLGRGTAPVKEVKEFAEKMGFSMVVESETITPDGPTEAAICFDYLKTI